MKIKGLSVENVCVGNRHFQKFGYENIFLTHSRKFMSVKLQLFSEFSSSRKLPIL